MQLILAKTSYYLEKRSVYGAFFKGVPAQISVFQEDYNRFFVIMQHLVMFLSHLPIVFLVFFLYTKAVE